MVVEQVGNMLINDGTFLLDECIQRARELRQARARLADPAMVDPQQARYIFFLHTHACFLAACFIINQFASWLNCLLYPLAAAAAGAVLTGHRGPSRVPVTNVKRDTEAVPHAVHARARGAAVRRAVRARCSHAPGMSNLARCLVTNCTLQVDVKTRNRISDSLLFPPSTICCSCARTRTRTCCRCSPRCATAAAPSSTSWHRVSTSWR